jgi:CRISPR-associated protein Csy2
MTQPNYPQALAVVRLRVEHASIISSHLTWGFPSPTAFVGFGHALERQLQAKGLDLNIVGVGVVCHAFHPQVDDSGYTLQLNLARHPLESNGSAPALVEEGKAHLDVSVLLGLTGSHLLGVWPSDDQQVSPETKAFLDQLYGQMLQMRLAGGSVFAHRTRPQLMAWSSGDVSKQSRKLYRRLLPGFSVMDRSELIATHQTWLAQHPPFLAQAASADAMPTRLDTLLDLARLNIGADPSFDDSETPEDVSSNDSLSQQTDAEADPSNAKVKWRVRPRPAHQQGWLIPVPLGYGALTDVQPAGSVDGARDDQSPVVFVESLIGLGEWISPHRITDLASTLWAYLPDTEHGVYRVYQPFATDAKTPASYLQYTTNPHNISLDSEDY